MLARTWVDGGVDLAAQSLTHALVAALAIEALLRLWRVRAPADRFALRLCGLAQPLLVTPALYLLWPAGRLEAGEGLRGALFASRRWDELQVAGRGALPFLVAAGAFLGLALFLMDLVPLVRRRRQALPPAAPTPPALAGAVAAAAAARGAPAPPVHYLDAGGAALFCAGVARPLLVVSRGTLALLDAAELTAAIGHELAHLARRDPAASWGLMGLRGLLCLNPVAQVVARALARDAEWRADEEAGGDRLALASAVVKLHRAGLRQGAGRTALAGPLQRARSHDVVLRCRRLLEPAPPAAVPFRAARLALVTASLAGLAFLVT